jgi:hypothetical protein
VVKNFPLCSASIPHSIKKQQPGTSPKYPKELLLASDSHQEDQL